MPEKTPCIAKTNILVTPKVSEEADLKACFVRCKVAGFNQDRRQQLLVLIMSETIFGVWTRVQGCFSERNERHEV